MAASVAGCFFFFFFFAVVLATASSGGSAALVEHTFIVSQMKLNHLCNDTLVTVVNGQLPGPAIEVTEGDSLVVHVVNKSPHGVTIHWHGVKQQLNCWADGAGMITQCPIQPNKNFTYRFDVAGQEGTLWWHAHVTSLRVTVHGALIIRPRSGPDSYPFPKPDKEIPIVIDLLTAGEWWETDPFELDRRFANSDFADVPRSSTINGKLGDLNTCSGVTEDNYVLEVELGKTYLLRIVNAALHPQYYFKIAGHTFTVVAVDANYVKPYMTDTIVIAAGETVDVLVVAAAAPTGGRYYMVALGIMSLGPLTKTPVFISRGVMSYTANASGKGTSDDTGPIMVPEMPDYRDETMSFYFHGNLTSLRPVPVPGNIDERLLIAVDTGRLCRQGSVPSPPAYCMVTRMNNISFQLPTTTSLLQAYYKKDITMITSLRDFPSRPPPRIVFNRGYTSRGVSVWRVRYNTTVEVVLQGPPTPASYSNPMHLHGHDFFILAQGLGRYNAEKDVYAYNLVDPPVRNMALVPMYGWTVIRFVTTNPGVWFLHCHLAQHVSSGMAMAFVVENGPTTDTTLPPPPADYPSCDDPDDKVGYE
ncbi:laccase-20 isoform X1 [Triticum aestivum]|uniref:laccase-20 isoform X1 n=1 Tax=Triticum aestivum TaxID=4565 RepID=UPI001D0156E7|nr:laccase-20-like isoform X1 [Triticum aestivum]